MTTVNDAIQELKGLVAGLHSLIAELEDYDGDKPLKKVDDLLRDEVVFHLGYDI